MQQGQDGVSCVGGQLALMALWQFACNAGLEYDLDLFNIVAVDDFNMGAMENKSLNIFNSRLVIASPSTSTDTDYSRVEGVVGHEYFHNWTGNRVTCRDWFQLTLKEGLTVFRDQVFAPAHQSCMSVSQSITPFPATQWLIICLTFIVRGSTQHHIQTLTEQPW